jgi:hypothetical protein
MEQSVSFPRRGVPAWSAVAEVLASRGYAVQMRMIDGELAFPDEAPPEPWRELRLGTPQGMVTVRRQAEAVALVTWGNADSALRQAWNAMAWAFAQAGGGLVQTPQGPLDAAGFARQAELPAALREGGGS